LFKVHGSINRFTTPNGQVECDLWIDEVPDGCMRVIAAPGEQKYEQYAGIIETAARGKQSQGEAMAFAVIGYGFNDPHLHEGIFERVRKQDCPLLVMTLDLGDPVIEELRGLGKQVWVLVAPNLAARKSDETRTVVYMPGNVGPFLLDGKQLWSCDSFAQEILGG
jgi:hypothetical protein